MLHNEEEFGLHFFAEPSILLCFQKILDQDIHGVDPLVVDQFFQFGIVDGVNVFNEFIADLGGSFHFHFDDGFYFFGKGEVAGHEVQVPLHILLVNFFKNGFCEFVFIVEDPVEGHFAYPGFFTYLFNTDFPDSIERLIWKGWDVSGFKGKQARLSIVDNHSGGWGHINIDQITFADEIAHTDISGSVWLDAGRDNYAGVTWSNQPDNRRIFLGWMSNWAYAQIVPTEKWRSAMTIPWDLSIRHIDGIPRLIGNPVLELNQLREQEIELQETTALPEQGLTNFELSFDLSTTNPSGFRIFNDQDEFIQFTYDPASNEFTFDRSKSGQVDFSGDFCTLARVSRLTSGDELKMNVWLDISSVEIFLDDGANIFTEIFFPTNTYTSLEILNFDQVVASKMYSLKRIW